jgi:fucose 4-O-acetylase-like acetyltransferase
MASPLISAADLSSIHPYLRAWFVPDANYFSFFPWGAYIAFGVAGGAILRLVQEEAMERVMLWSAFFGAALWAGSRYFADLPYSIYAHSDFWLNGPLLILIKTGIILMILPVAFLWTRHVNPHGWSVLRQLGTTSLLVYWVHTELVYGSLFWMFKENLNLWQVLAMSAFIIISMIALSMAKTGWGTHPAASVWFRHRWMRWRDAFSASPGSVTAPSMPSHQPAGD